MTAVFNLVSVGSWSPAVIPSPVGSIAPWRSAPTWPFSRPLHIFALAFSMWLLTGVGRDEEARTIADETLAAARAHGNPFYIAMALANGQGRALAKTDPHRALNAFREALADCREHRLLYGEDFIAYNAAGLEAVHGDPDTALELFDFAIDTCHRSGDPTHLALAFASVAVHFDRVERPDIAATLYGSSTKSPSIAVVPGLPDTVQHLRAGFSPAVFDGYITAGLAMEVGDAVAYARQQIRLARQAKEPT
jgi:hypothetical protein